MVGIIKLLKEIIDELRKINIYLSNDDKGIRPIVPRAFTPRARHIVPRVVTRNR